ncbi:PD-(D/E)XK motif protein, partial [Amylibacter sp.]|nr:PD-(D/E)XK motif protein [Amylibacter sp.]
SSEYQLDINEDKSLELAVICIEKDFENGNSIKDLILEIKEIIINKLGELSIFFNSLQMLGLNHSNMDGYNEYKYTIISLTSYDCLNNDFPKLISSNIGSEHIQRVRYNLDLRNLDEFILEEIDLLNVT